MSAYAWFESVLVPLVGFALISYLMLRWQTPSRNRLYWPLKLSPTFAADPMIAAGTILGMTCLVLMELTHWIFPRMTTLQDAFAVLAGVTLLGGFALSRLNAGRSAEKNLS